MRGFFTSLKNTLNRFESLTHEAKNRKNLGTRTVLWNFWKISDEILDRAFFFFLWIKILINISILGLYSMEVTSKLGSHILIPVEHKHKYGHANLRHLYRTQTQIGISEPNSDVTSIEHKHK